MARPEAPVRAVLGRLEGRECSFCSSGELVRSTYKGNAAVVCEECETPQVQFW